MAPPPLHRSSSLPVGHVTMASNTPATASTTDNQNPKAPIQKTSSLPTLPVTTGKKKEKSSRRLQRKKSSVSGLLRKTEAEMWEEYTGAYDEEERYEDPGWKHLISQGIKRRIGKFLTAKQRKRGAADKIAKRLLDHWVFTRTMAFDATSNRLGLKGHNFMPISEEWLDIQPSFAEYMDGMLTLCTEKSGGVWDLDQKWELLVGVHGRAEHGKLNRDEFSDCLKKHAKVKSVTGEGKGKGKGKDEGKSRPGNMSGSGGGGGDSEGQTQQEFEVQLYRWVKRNWKDVHQLLDLKAILHLVEGNDNLTSHFSLDLEQLSIDLCRNDQKQQEEQKYMMIFQQVEERLKGLLEKKRKQRLGLVPLEERELGEEDLLEEVSLLTAKEGQSRPSSKQIMKKGGKGGSRPKSKQEEKKTSN